MMLFAMYASCKPDSLRPAKGFGLPDPSFSLLFMPLSGVISFDRPANLFDSYPNLFSPPYLHRLNMLRPHLFLHVLKRYAPTNRKFKIIYPRCP
jgi:hypothetical protein